MWYYTIFKKGVMLHKSRNDMLLINLFVTYHLSPLHITQVLLNEFSRYNTSLVFFSKLKLTKYLYQDKYVWIEYSGICKHTYNTRWKYISSLFCTLNSRYDIILISKHTETERMISEQAYHQNDTNDGKLCFLWCVWFVFANIYTFIFSYRAGRNK